MWLEEAPSGQGADGAASTAKRNPCVGAMAAFDNAQFRSPSLRQVSPMLASDDEVCVEAMATLTVRRRSATLFVWLSSLALRKS